LVVAAKRSNAGFRGQSRRQLLLHEPVQGRDIYVGFLHVLHEVANTLDVRLVYSRDGCTGIRWTNDGHGLRRAKTDGINTLSTPTPRPSRWAMKCSSFSAAPTAARLVVRREKGGPRSEQKSGFAGIQSVDHVHYGLGVARMRRDGFVSLDAGPMREGVLVTNALRTGGHQLIINAACAPGGYIRSRPPTENENVLNGCTRELSQAFTGGRHAACCRLEGSQGHSARRRRPAAILLRNASLYSFKVQ